MTSHPLQEAMMPKTKTNTIDSLKIVLLGPPFDLYILFTGLQITKVATTLATSGNPVVIIPTPSSGLTIQKTGSKSESSRRTDMQNNGLSIQRNSFTSHNLFGERIQNPLCYDIEDDSSSDQSNIDILDTSEIKAEAVDPLKDTVQPDTNPNVDHSQMIKISFKEKPMITLRTENPICIEVDSDSDISSTEIKLDAEVLDNQPDLEYALKDGQTSDTDLEDNISMEIVPFCNTLDANSIIPKIKTEPEATMDINIPKPVTTDVYAKTANLPKRKSRRPSRYGDNGYDELESRDSRYTYVVF